MCSGALHSFYRANFTVKGVCLPVPYDLILYQNSLTYINYHMLYADNL